MATLQERYPVGWYVLLSWKQYAVVRGYTRGGGLIVETLVDYEHAAGGMMTVSSGLVVDCKESLLDMSAAGGA